jgi:septum formation protein
MSQRIVLASASPRREALLAQIGIDCEVMPSQIGEEAFENEAPLDYVRRMAEEKARSVAGIVPERIVLGADTDVVMQSRILGKPRDRDDFMEMFRLLSASTHQVITAVSLVHGEQSRLKTSISDVTFREVSEAEMLAYWETGEPCDKAGGYGIQGLAAMFVRAISGSYSGIMGLPLYETSELLRGAGIRLLQEKNT